MVVVISCTKFGLLCQKLFLCENVLVFDHYAINVHKGEGKCF